VALFKGGGKKNLEARPEKAEKSVHGKKRGLANLKRGGSCVVEDGLVKGRGQGKREETLKIEKQIEVKISH